MRTLTLALALLAQTANAENVDRLLVKCEAYAMLYLKIQRGLDSGQLKIAEEQKKLNTIFELLIEDECPVTVTGCPNLTTPVCKKNIGLKRFL